MLFLRDFFGFKFYYKDNNTYLCQDFITIK